MKIQSRAARVFRVRHVLFTGMFLCLLCGLRPGAAAAADDDFTCGQIDPVEILKNSHYALDAKEKLKEEFTGTDKSIVALMVDIKELEDDYLKHYRHYNPAEKKEKKQAILDRKQELVKQQNEFKAALTQRREEEFDKIKKLVFSSIVESAKKNRLDAVVDNENEPVYSRKGRDFTCAKTIPFSQTVIDEMNNPRPGDGGSNPS